jgi:hypothetical protein
MGGFSVYHLLIWVVLKYSSVFRTDRLKKEQIVSLSYLSCHKFTHDLFSKANLLRHLSVRFLVGSEGLVG